MTDSNSTLPATANDAQVTSQPAPTSSQSDGNASSRKTSILILLLLIVLLFLASGAGIYFWQKLMQQETVIEHLSQQKQSQSDRLISLERSVNNKVNQLEVYAQSTTEKLTAIDRQALYNTQQLNELGASSRADWLLAEVEYLLHLANQKLNLEKDFTGTEAVLAAADKVLAEISDPGLLPIREAIGKEVFSLQQIKRIDQQGIYTQIAALIGALDDIETDAYLKTKEVLPEPIMETNPEVDANRVWDNIWEDLKTVVTIRRLDEPVAPLMAPEQSYYLKQNLRLMLEQASVALLERNQMIFQDSLNKAYNWLSTYFELKNPLIRSFIERLEVLKTTQIEFAMPDISESLRLTKKKIEAMYRHHSLGKLNSRNDETVLKQENQ